MTLPPPSLEITDLGIRKVEKKSARLKTQELPRQKTKKGNVPVNKEKENYEDAKGNLPSRKMRRRQN